MIGVSGPPGTTAASAAPVPGGKMTGDNTYVRT